MEERRVVARQLADVADPPALTAHAESVAVGGDVRERGEPLGLRGGREESLAGAERVPVGQEVIDVGDQLAGRVGPRRVPVGRVGWMFGCRGLSLHGEPMGIRLGQDGGLARRRGVRQAERIEDPALEHIGDGLTRHLLDDLAQQHQVGVRVEVVGARLEHRRLGDPDGEDLVRRDDLVRCREVGVGELRAERVAGHAGGHVGQHAQRDSIAVRHPRDVLLDGVVERHLAFLGKLQEQRDRERLGDRPDAGVHADLHRRVGGRVGEAVGLRPRPLRRAHTDDGAGRGDQLDRAGGCRIELGDEIRRQGGRRGCRGHGRGDHLVDVLHAEHVGRGSLRGRRGGRGGAATRGRHRRRSRCRGR